VSRLSPAQLMRVTLAEMADRVEDRRERQAGAIMLGVRLRMACGTHEEAATERAYRDVVRALHLTIRGGS